MQEFIEIANLLADESRKIIHQHFRTSFDVESKGDESPVTIADRAVEKRMREIIEDKRPNDGILGEEFGMKSSENGLTWVLDPIDGTTSFVIGRPTFGTLVALAENDVPVLGIIDQAILGERWVGIKGEQTTFNDASVQTQKCHTLKNARAVSCTPIMFDPATITALHRETKMMVWGGDCYSYGLLASGHCDLVIETLLSPYDFAALVPIVEGAGGIMKDWSGHALTLQSDGRVIAASDSGLMSEALALVRV